MTLLSEGLKVNKGRMFLLSSPAPIGGQIVTLDGEKATVMWVAPVTFASSEFGGGDARPIVVAYGGLFLEPWANQIQAWPPEAGTDRRTDAQKTSDEAARLVALGTAPLGGAYSVFWIDAMNGGGRYPKAAKYVGPASAVISL